MLYPMIANLHQRKKIFIIGFNHLLIHLVGLVGIESTMLLGQGLYDSTQGRIYADGRAIEFKREWLNNYFMCVSKYRS